nr:CAP domain-containing protein [Sporolactobacillus vineae]
MKKLLALTLAGALALPFVSGGNAQAASKPVSVNYTKLFDGQKLKGSQVSDLEGILRQLGLKLDLSQVNNGVYQKVKVPANCAPAAKKPAPETAQPAKPKQPAKPAPAANNNSEAKANPKTGSQLNAFEKKVVDLTNQERTKAGLSPLKSDNATLSKMARDKSADMRDKNYFDHQSPTYGSPFDMMKKYGITYRAAGENIAAGQKTPEEVVNGWMNSPGHRANILNANYTTIGVGYVTGGSYGSYWTQEFIGN